MHQALELHGLSCKSTLRYFTKLFTITETITSYKSIQRSSTILHVTQKAENTEEEVDEIEIEANRSHDVLIGGEAAVDEVCVIDDIPTEQQSAPNGVNETHSRVEWNEHANKAGHNCHSVRSAIQRTKEITLPNARRPPNSHGPIPEKSYYKGGSLKCRTSEIQRNSPCSVA